MALATWGCSNAPGSSDGGLPDADSAPQTAPDDYVSIPLDEVRAFALSGYYPQPQVVIVETREQFVEHIGDPSSIDINFSEETAAWVGWYLPDACTQRSLVSVLRNKVNDDLEIRYRTERDPEQVCAAVVMPFEEILVFEGPGRSARLIIDDQEVASWPLD